MTVKSSLASYVSPRLSTYSSQAMSSALTQLHESIAAGDHYSAHQKARTTATRLLAPPRRGPAPTPDANGFLPFDTKAQEAATLLYEGAVALLEKGQTGSGVDLAGYLCDVWKARGVACGAEERGEFFVQRGMALELLWSGCESLGGGCRTAELSLRRRSSALASLALQQAGGRGG